MLKRIVRIVPPPEEHRQHTGRRGRQRGCQPLSSSLDRPLEGDGFTWKSWWQDFKEGLAFAALVGVVWFLFLMAVGGG